jgi:hypothetical protein
MEFGAINMFSVATLRKQVGTRAVGFLRSARYVVELQFAQFDQLGLVAALLAHDRLRCCAGWRALPVDPGLELRRGSDCHRDAGHSANERAARRATISGRHTSGP